MRRKGLLPRGRTIQLVKAKRTRVGGHGAFVSKRLRKNHKKGGGKCLPSRVFASQGKLIYSKRGPTDRRRKGNRKLKLRKFL